MGDIEKKLKDLERLKNLLSTEEYGKKRADIISSIDGGRGGRGEAAALSVHSIPASSSSSSNKDDNDDDDDEYQNDDDNNDTIIRLVVSNTNSKKRILPPRYGVDNRTQLLSMIGKIALNKKEDEDDDDDDDNDDDDTDNDKEEFFQSFYHQIDTALRPLNKIRTTAIALFVFSILGFSFALIVAEMYAVAGTSLAVVIGTSIGTLYYHRPTSELLPLPNFSTEDLNLIDAWENLEHFNDKFDTWYSRIGVVLSLVSTKISFSNLYQQLHPSWFYLPAIACFVACWYITLYKIPVTTTNAFVTIHSLCLSFSDNNVNLGFILFDDKEDDENKEGNNNEEGESNDSNTLFDPNSYQFFSFQTYSHICIRVVAVVNNNTNNHVAPGGGRRKGRDRGSIYDNRNYKPETSFYTEVDGIQQVAKGRHKLPTGVVVEELKKFQGMKEFKDDCPNCVIDLLTTKGLCDVYDRFVQAIYDDTTTRNPFGFWNDQQFVHVLDLFRDEFITTGNADVVLCKRRSEKAVYRWIEFIDRDVIGRNEYVSQYDVSNWSGQSIKTYHSKLKFPNGIALVQLKQWGGRKKLKQQSIPIYLQKLLTEYGLENEYEQFIDQCIQSKTSMRDATRGGWNVDEILDLIQEYRPMFRRKGIDLYVCHKQEFVVHGHPALGGHCEYYRWIEFVDRSKQPNYLPQRNADEKEEKACTIM